MNDKKIIDVADKHKIAMCFSYKSLQALMGLKVLIIGSGGREHARMDNI